MKRRLFLSVLVACLAFQARANLIDLGVYGLPGPIGSPSEEATWIQSLEHLANAPTFMAKAEDGLGWTDVGFLKGTISVPTSLGTSANVMWDLEDGSTLGYILVKDGEGTIGNASGMLYHLYGVADDQRSEGSGDVEIGGKGISHISLFGFEGGDVPDGGVTAVLLGLGLCATEMFRRKYFT